MPSNYTASLRLEKQFTGENVNVWGDRLNTVFDRTDTAIAGLTTIALTGDHALSTSNGAADEARSAMLKFTGGTGPFTVTIPAVSKSYRVWNAAGGPVTLTTGAGATVQVDASDVVDVFCDGAGVQTPGFGGVSLKDHIASVVVGGGATLPSVVGQAGKFLTNTGAAANWVNPTVANISDYAADQAAKTAAATARAIAFAVAL